MREKVNELVHARCCYPIALVDIDWMVTLLDFDQWDQADRAHIHLYQRLTANEGLRSRYFIRCLSQESFQCRRMWVVAILGEKLHRTACGLGVIAGGF